MLFADVIIDRSLQKLDKTFQYRVPERLAPDISVGTLVQVPFGRGNRPLKGYVVSVTQKPAYDVEKMKERQEVLHEGVVIESQLLALAYFIHDNYGSTLNDALKTVLPVKKQVQARERRWLELAVEREEAAACLEECQRKHYVAQARLIQALLESERVSYDDVLHRLHIQSSVVKKLQEKGILTVESQTMYRNPLHARAAAGQAVSLNGQQRAIVEDFLSEYHTGKRGTYLIHGITGSGKTEVYMGMIEGVLAQGNQVIMLIPEIALTFQTVNRFYGRFGDRISIMHSRLSGGERYDQYLRAKRGEIDIMIGPRSAVFTPFSNLGLIIMDEEHEGSYKSDSPPKYHAREVAVQRASMAGASVVLGSATPSLEAYYRVESGRYKLYRLNERAGKGTIPRIHITDLRQEFANKNRSMFGEELKELLTDRISRGEQSILFLNRRGYAGFVSCRKCGFVVNCPHCAVSLTTHRRGRGGTRLVCHYCGFEQDMVETCPSCGSRYIAGFGTGTQKVEEMVKELFPTARVLRMDADTTSGKNGHEEILAKFANKEADILIGTQMIVKGHDFPDVTLVGILAADMSLSVGDFQAAERTFQLLSQAAGRAGRGEKPGEVVIQTYQPEHYCIQSAAAGDYEGFYKKEMEYRKLLQYPPVSNILAILVFSAREKSADAFACRIAELLRDAGGTGVIGPAPAALSKARDTYRRVIYVKCRDYTVLRDRKNRIAAYYREHTEYGDTMIQFDFNPMGNY